MFTLLSFCSPKIKTYKVVLSFYLFAYLIMALLLTGLFDLDHTIKLK